MGVGPHAQLSLVYPDGPYSQEECVMVAVRFAAGATMLVLLSTSPAPMGAQAGDTTLASVKTTYEAVKGYITKAAAQVPEDKYKYQPTKDVRTMGQLFGHIANASGLICSTASGMKPTPRAMPRSWRRKPSSRRPSPPRSPSATRRWG